MDILDILRVPCEEFLTSKLHFHESPAKQRSGSVCQRCYNTIYLQINGTSTSAEQCHYQEDCIAVLNCYNYLINKLPQTELKPHLFNLPFSALERKNVEAVGPSCSTNISCSPELLKVTTAVDESCVAKKSLPAIETNTETSHLTDSSEVVEVVRGSEQEIVNDAKVSEYLSVADHQNKLGSNTCQDKTKKTAVVEEKASIQIVEPTEIVQQPVNTHVVRENTPKKMSDEKTPAELGKECKGVGKVVQQLKNGVRRVIGNPKAHSSGTEYADRERNYPIFDNNLRDIWTFDGFRPIANIPHSVGLQNHGNTCFMNVIIQSLVHLPPFARFINDKHVHPNGKVYDECIACMFRQKIYQQAFSRHNGAIGVKWLLSLWPHLFRARFARQEADAHEFMIKLFDKIQKDIKRYFVYEGSSSGPIPSCPLEQIFYGKTREYSECICGASSARYENFCVYPLPVPDSNPRGRRMGVADLLELNGKKAPPVDFKCDKCGRYRKCGSVLYRCPSVLIFQIMCFRYTSYGKTIKIQQELYPEEVLSLKNFTFKNEEVTYDLSSVISHAGSINHGHYTSTTKGFDKKWYEFDDDRVRRCSLTGRSFYPYLLFYTRRSYPDRVYASPSVVLTPRELLKSRPSERSVGVRPASERQKKPTKLYSPEMKKSSTVQNAIGSKKETDVRSPVRMLPTNGSSKSSGHKDGRTCMPSSVTHPHKSYEKSNKARNGNNGSHNGKSQPTLSNGISSNGHATPLNCTVSEENIKLHNGIASSSNSSDSGFTEMDMSANSLSTLSNGVCGSMQKISVNGKVKSPSCSVREIPPNLPRKSPPWSEPPTTNGACSEMRLASKPPHIMNGHASNGEREKVERTNHATKVVFDAPKSNGFLANGDFSRSTNCARPTAAPVVNGFAATEVGNNTCGKRKLGSAGGGNEHNSVPCGMRPEENVISSHFTASDISEGDDHCSQASEANGIANGKEFYLTDESEAHRRSKRHRKRTWKDILEKSSDCSCCHYMLSKSKASSSNSHVHKEHGNSLNAKKTKIC